MENLTTKKIFKILAVSANLFNAFSLLQGLKALCLVYLNFNRFRALIYCIIINKRLLNLRVNIVDLQMEISLSNRKDHPEH